MNFLRLMKTVLLMRLAMPAALALAVADLALAFDDAESAAIFRAAGFELLDGRQVRCREDPPTMSYVPGSIATVDLNEDGQPEAWVTEGSVFCYGNTAAFFVLLARDREGRWVRLLEGPGIAVVRTQRHEGWSDIEVGGPGPGPFPVYRFDGKAYVRQ